eukprot:TRINITY_DN2378_c0_g1_i1.p1 TRINITY_DN2378_c0_g1~~TRINITY_DN2378_c0_g1_i1.p1  ORF type:complete len:73 (-),score=17.19 TRINITY_DN2378_c0_g1_i1:70-288(-)
MIQVVLANGKRLKLMVNKQHKIIDIYQHILHVTGGGDKFELLGGFPVKKLSDPWETVESAKLNGARVTQKLI